MTHLRVNSHFLNNVYIFFMYKSMPLYLACHKRNASTWDHLSRACFSSAMFILRWKERIEVMMKIFCFNFTWIPKRYNVKLKAKQYQANLPGKVWMNSSWQIILMKVPEVTSHPVVILCSFENRRKADDRNVTFPNSNRGSVYKFIKFKLICSRLSTFILVISLIHAQITTLLE